MAPVIYHGRMRPIMLALLLVLCACSTVTRDRNAVLAEAHGVYALMILGANSLEFEMVRGPCCAGGALLDSAPECRRGAMWIGVARSRAAWHRDATLAGAGLGDDPGPAPDVAVWECPEEGAP